MDIVLGVSMTPTAVRMALVEGKAADGVTLDQDRFDVAAGVSAATSDAPEQVVAAILGTRESAAEGGHHLAATGVAWTDHAAAARLRQALRAQRMDDVILVSELHAASALAQAIGRAVECERTALLFVERDTATLAVVSTADGSVLKVSSRSLASSDPVTALQEMVAGLESDSQAPQTLFMVGSGVDIAALKPRIAALTTLPVHAPPDGDLALARGAALAAATAPRYEASTVGLLAADDTAAGPTQMAAAGYMAPLGYSAVTDDEIDIEGADLLEADVDDQPAPADRRPFLLVGSALSAVFVVGVVALVISLAVAIRPTVDQRPVPGDSAVVSNSQPAPPVQAEPPPAPAAIPETIQAPVPVVQEAPRTVYVAPKEAVPAPAPAAPAPAAQAPEPAAAPQPAPAPAAPAPAPAAPAPLPAPAIAPPVVVPVPIVPPLLPRIFQVPSRGNPLPQYPRTYPTYPSAPSAPSTPAPTTQAPQPSSQPTTVAPTTAYPTYTAPVTTQAPSSGSGSGSGGSDSDGESGRNSRGSQVIWPPLWPFGG